MQPFQPHLDWIASQEASMLTLLTEWVNVNSWSDNPEGLETMAKLIATSFESLGGETEILKVAPRKQITPDDRTIEIPTGNCLRFTKHRDAPLRILLGGHMDTVFPPFSDFNAAFPLGENTLCGPGVADMKGGLIVLLTALRALERSPYAGKIGWEVLINADEEVGSISSELLWQESAKRNAIGLLFEPAMPNGSLVSARKGSANFVLTATGKAAHAGRDFAEGRSAIFAISRVINALEALSDPAHGITLNVGFVLGGGPVNIVPKHAVCRINVRAISSDDFKALILRLQQVIDEFSHDKLSEGILFRLHPEGARPPKLFDKKHEALFQTLATCAKDLDLTLHHQPSGGVSDGNILASAGLPTLDTLGVVGGNLHTNQEYVLVSSLVERATLAAYFLMKLAAREISLPGGL